MTKAPMTKTAKGASKGLRRFQFIEPIASPKTLVIAGAKEILSAKIDYESLGTEPTYSVAILLAHNWSVGVEASHDDVKPYGLCLLTAVAFHAT